MTSTSSPLSELYHIGFHLSTLFEYRFLSLIAKIDLAEAMLLSGLKFSILSCMTFYLLVKKMSSSELVALVATVLCSFWAPFPSYLTSWARYPFVAGLSILPLIMLFGLELSRKVSTSIALSLLCLLACLFLYHYSIFFYALCFIAAIIVSGLFRDGVGRSMTIATFALLFFIMFMISIKVLVISQKVDLQQVLATNLSEVASEDAGYILGLTIKNNGIIIWLAGASGLVHLLTQPSRFGRLLLVHLALIIVFYGTQFVIFQGFVFSLTNIIIASSFFLCLFSVPMFEWLFSKVAIPNYSANILIIGLGILGLYNISNIVNPVTILYTKDDREAIIWLNDNLPSNAVVFINSFRWGEKYMPSDGGAWITNLIGRRTVYAQTPLEMQGFNVSIRANTVSYVYLGGGLGELDVTKFMTSPDYELVYKQEGTKIFRVRP